MDKPQNHYAKLRKANKRDYTWYEYIYIKCPGKENLWRNKGYCLPMLEVEGTRIYSKST